MIGVGSDSRLGYPLEIALGVGEPARARYMSVILVLPVTNVTLGIGKCEGVGEDSRHGKSTCP